MGTEEEDSQAPEPSEESAPGPVGGERLAATRRKRGISIREIAKELHLDESKVRALEENRFDVLGAPVFVKGHMRKYAELVGVPIDDMLSDYYQLNRSIGAPPVVRPPQKLPRELSVGPWAGGIVVILVIVIAGWWWISSKPALEPAAVPPATLAPSGSEREGDSAPAADDTAVESSDNPEISVLEAEPQSESDLALTEDVRHDESALAGNLIELELAFSGDCWTEVTDATGRRMYFDLGTDGRTVSLNGVEPLRVLLGDSSNVSMRVNGFDYSIPAANRRGNTARLTIYGQ